MILSIVFCISESDDRFKRLGDFIKSIIEANEAIAKSITIRETTKLVMSLSRLRLERKTRKASKTVASNSTNDHKETICEVMRESFTTPA